MLNLQKLSCKKLRDILGDIMNSKKLNARDISELLGIEDLLKFKEALFRKTGFFLQFQQLLAVKI